MNVEFSFAFDVPDPSIKTLLKVFVPAIKELFQVLVRRTVEVFAEQSRKKLAEELNTELIWKSKAGNRETWIHTLLGAIRVQMPQVQRKDTGEKMYLTRYILEMERYRRIPLAMREIFAKMGASFPYRVGMKIVNFFSGGLFGLSSLHRAVQEIGGKVKASLSIKASDPHVFEADGTGIPIKSRGLRGGELKILSQRRKDGSLRVVGIGIGAWKQNWDILFSGLRKTFARFKRPVTLITDGDHNIARAFQAVLPRKLKMHNQRCTWHLLHELKYCLWQDGASPRGKSKKAKELGGYAMQGLHGIMELVRAIPEMTLNKRKVEARRARREMLELANWCTRNGLLHSASLLTRVYVERAFGGAAAGVKGTTTSKQERMMGTLNKRINVGGNWSEKGSEAVATLRLAEYYNGWLPEVWFGDKKA